MISHSPLQAYVQMGNWGSVMTHAAKADAIPDFAANLKVEDDFYRIAMYSQ